MAAATTRLLNDRYQLGALLGEGATATVSRAFDRLLHREVAVKILKPAFAQDAGVVERFYAEARAAAGLVDAHAVGVYDVLADGPVHAIVMELVDGPSLAAVLKSEGRVSEARAVAYARQIAQALAAAHARGIVHRDIKPANVLLAPGEFVKVADFGLAKAFEHDDLALTEPGRLVGSAYYFSPEQAQGLPLTPASDLYSLGVVLYQLVTGSLPFDATSPVSVAVAHVTQPPPSESTMARTMSPALAAVVARLLRKDPRERIAGAADLAAALTAVEQATMTTPATNAEPDWDAPTMIGTAPVAEMQPVVKRRRAGPSSAARAAAALAAAMAAVTAAAAAFFSWGWRRSQRTLAPAFGALAARVSRRASRVPVPAAAIGGAVLILLIVLVALARSPSAVALADVRGQPLAQARSALASVGLAPTAAMRADDAIPSGTVIAQSPAAGAPVHRGDAVHLTVSSGPATVSVPNLVGTTLAGAHAAMQRLSLHGRYAARIADAAPNTVVEQFPAAGTRLRHGSQALIVISTGPQPHIVLTNSGPSYAPPGWRKHHRGARRHGGGDGGDGGD